MPLPAGPTDPRTVVAELAAAADPGRVASFGIWSTVQSAPTRGGRMSNWQTTDDDVERTLAAYAGQLAAR